MSGVATVALASDHVITRVIRGGWQLAGGHGDIAAAQAVEDLIAAFDAGITTFDCADIYTGVEEIYGAFRAALADRRGQQAARALKIHTKLVPDLASLADVTKASIEAIIDRSLRRLRVEHLDLVQFHWWDYAIPGADQAMAWLDEIRRAGKIRHLGGTNFDTPHLARFLAAGVPMIAMQVQYSLLDRRPENGMTELCRSNGVDLLCYGSVAGGFLSDRWLGAPEPPWPPENRSLIKYKLIIDDFGGWALFQELLRTLRGVADRHGTDIATIASALMLDRPAVAAVIVGARNAAHANANAAITSPRFSPSDHAAIEAVTSRAMGPEGDVFTLERDRAGRHGSIMKYNLNSN